METGKVQAVQPQNWREALSGDLLLDIFSETPSGGTFVKWRLWIWNRPRLYMLLLECRSFAQRIQMLATSSDIYESPTDYVSLLASSLVGRSRYGRIRPEVQVLSRLE